MAVAMEVAWRGAELGSKSGPVLDLGKKRAWGADTEKLMQLMMGQFGATTTTPTSPSSLKPAEVTLDLLGTGGSSSSSCRGAPELDCNSSPEFLELDPDQPLPSGWEKCLDLKTGELYFVNKSSGVRTSEDPRRQLQQQPAAVVVVASEHEFLASKRSETESLQRASTSSASSGGSPPPQRLSFSTGKQLWSLQLDDRSTVSLNKTASSLSPPPPPTFLNSEEESDLELNLNLSAGGSSPSRHQSVCTMEMVEKALKRTEKAMGKREMLGPKPSGSSSFSSLTSSRSEPSLSHSSPSTSSSSSTTSSRSAAAAHLDESQVLRSSASGICEAESRKAEANKSDGDALVMGACTRCLSYVMVHKSEPKCPRCESAVPLDSFLSPPSSKRQRLDAPM